MPHHEECPQHHGHKGDPGVTPGTCAAIGERAQLILVWVKTPSIGNASELWVADGVMILECSTTPQVEVWAWRYDNLSGALPMDNALGQKWHKSHARDCLGWNMHNFLGICPNGASEGSIGIYRHSRCHLSGCLLDLHNKCKSYGGLKLLGDYTSTAKGNCYLMVG